jgi:ethanolamine ammonia-lyase small subunit
MPTPRGLASRRCAYRPFASFAPNTAILQNAITEGLSVRTIRAFYRDHFIDLEEDVKQEGWRVVAIIHSTLSVHYRHRNS